MGKIMTQEELDRLEAANTEIFEVEQIWRKKGYEYAAHTLYLARIEINNARSRGQKGEYKPTDTLGF